MNPGVYHLLFGVAFNPVGQGALAWEDADQLSGTLSGEFDGVLRPPLTAYAGWFDKQNAILADFAMVRFGEATYSDSSSLASVGSLRLGLDYRRYLPAAEAGPGKVDVYATAGLYGVLPTAGNTSDAYTEADQTAADEASAEQRARVGGLGGKLGLGAGYRIGGPASVTLGARGALVLHRAQSTLETGYSVSTLVRPEAVLTLEFRR